MAVPSTSEFLLRFPEFSEQSLSVVEGALAEAGRFVDSDSWGTIYSEAVTYLAAHNLATRTMQIGQQIGALSGSPNGDMLSVTLYGQEYKRLLSSLAISGFAL